LPLPKTTGGGFFFLKKLGEYKIFCIFAA